VSFGRLFHLLLEGFAPGAEVQAHRARTVHAANCQDDQVGHGITRSR